MNLKVKIGDLEFNNPVMNASGTFGMKDYEDYIDFSKIGAVVTKSITRERRLGNPPPRIGEFNGGIINSVGIQNDGVEKFIEDIDKNLKGLETRKIVSVSNTKLSDYKETIKRLETVEDIIDAYEINVSCPNLEAGGRAFGMSDEDTYKITKDIRKVTDKPIFIKLTPNVSDIIPIAKACKDAGADGVVVANTYTGMLVNLKTKRKLLGNGIGGVSGSGIKPLTLKLVYDISRNVNIPIIASGGAYNAQDVLEYLLVGATCVQIGSANFSDPAIMEKIVKDIENYMVNNKIEDINDFIGTLKD